MAVERQEDAAHILLRMEELGVEPYQLDEDERREIEAALAEAERGEFASDVPMSPVRARKRSDALLERIRSSCRLLAEQRFAGRPSDIRACVC